MSDLIVGYYLISGALFLFLVGSGSIICDMFLNKEKTIVIKKRKTQPETNLSQIVSNNHDVDNEFDY